MLGVLAIQAVDDILIVMLSFVSFVVLDDTLFIHTGRFVFPLLLSIQQITIVITISNVIIWKYMYSEFIPANSQGGPVILWVYSTHTTLT